MSNQSGNPIPVSLVVPLAESAAILTDYYVTLDPSTGNGNSNAGTTPDQICAGIAKQDTTAIATAGMSSIAVSQTTCNGEPASTVASDGFTAADMGTPFFIAGVKTPGKLTNTAGSARSAGWSSASMRSAIRFNGVA